MMELMTDYLEGRMGFFRRVSFQIHIGTCWQCRQYLGKLRATIDELGRLPPPEPPAPEVMAKLLEQFRGWKLDERETEGREPA
jgi:hypothetical protein